MFWVAPNRDRDPDDVADDHHGRIDTDVDTDVDTDTHAVGHARTDRVGAR
ncbi:MAG TPA: hypothetical protein VIK12_04320 [Pengzhenrongella sp.]